MDLWFGVETNGILGDLGHPCVIVPYKVKIFVYLGEVEKSGQIQPVRQRQLVSGEVNDY